MCPVQPWHGENVLINKHQYFRPKILIAGYTAEEVLSPMVPDGSLHFLKGTLWFSPTFQKHARLG